MTKWTGFIALMGLTVLTAGSAAAEIFGSEVKRVTGTGFAFAVCTTGRAISGSCQSTGPLTVSNPYEGGWLCETEGDHQVTADVQCITPEHGEDIGLHYARATTVGIQASDVQCPTNKVLLSGGCRHSDVRRRLRVSIPTGEDAWSCAYDVAGGEVTSIAVCVDAEAVVGYEQVTNSADGVDELIASCPAGKTAMAGGAGDLEFPDATSPPLLTGISGILLSGGEEAFRGRFDHVAPAEAVEVHAICIDNSGCQETPAWDLVALYLVGDRVTFEGNLYEAVINSRNAKPTLGTWWERLGSCP